MGTCYTSKVLESSAETWLSGRSAFLNRSLKKNFCFSEEKLLMKNAKNVYLEPVQIYKEKLGYV